MSVGHTLREARERRDITLGQISQATNIPRRVLEAIDSGDLTHLPGGLFTRAYLRAYAEQLGLEPDAVLAEYGVSRECGIDDDLSALRLRFANRGPGDSHWKVWLMAAALALVGGTAYVSVSRGANDGQAVVEATDVSQQHPSQP